MRVSSPTEARQGFIAAAISLPLTLVALGATLAFAGFVV